MLLVKEQKAKDKSAYFNIILQNSKIVPLHLNHRTYNVSCILWLRHVTNMHMFVELNKGHNTISFTKRQ